MRAEAKHFSNQHSRRVVKESNKSSAKPPKPSQRLHRARRDGRRLPTAESKERTTSSKLATVEIKFDAENVVKRRQPKVSSRASLRRPKVAMKNPLPHPPRRVNCKVGKSCSNNEESFDKFMKRSRDKRQQGSNACNNKITSAEAKLGSNLSSDTKVCRDVHDEGQIIAQRRASEQRSSAARSRIDAESEQDAFYANRRFNKILERLRVDKNNIKL